VFYDLRRRQTTAIGARRFFATPSNLIVDEDCTLFEEGEEVDVKMDEKKIFEFPKTISVINSEDGESNSEEVSPNRSVWGVPIRNDIVHRVVCWQRAGWRQGTSKTKSRGEVSGGGRKPWVQKGTGRARHGSIRSPIWRGGGHAHAKRPKDWSHKLNRKLRRMGMCVALSAKLAEGNLLLIDQAKVTEPKTREIVTFLEKHNLREEDTNGVLLLDHTLDSDFAQASQNISHRTFYATNVEDVIRDTNVYDIILRERLVITKAAFNYIEEQLSEKIARAGLTSSASSSN
jgi:large subunit ribosomal protein L4